MFGLPIFHPAFTRTNSPLPEVARTVPRAKDCIRWFLRLIHNSGPLAIENGVKEEAHC